MTYLAQNLASALNAFDELLGAQVGFLGIVFGIPVGRGQGGTPRGLRVSRRSRLSKLLPGSSHTRAPPVHGIEDHATKPLRKTESGVGLPTPEPYPLELLRNHTLDKREQEIANALWKDFMTKMTASSKPANRTP
jgi:hypothetical protein